MEVSLLHFYSIQHVSIVHLLQQVQINNTRQQLVSMTNSSNAKYIEHSHSMAALSCITFT